MVCPPQAPPALKHRCSVGIWAEGVGSLPPAIHLGLGWQWFLQPPFLLQILLHPALKT